MQPLKGINFNLLYKDIYFEPAYGKLCESIEEGTAEIFRLETDDGVISNMFLKKHVPVDLDPEQKYFDISTPYGYGGPIILELKGDKTKLISEFDRKFSQFCFDYYIFCEFIRFHPLIWNELDFKVIINTYFQRKTVATVLKDSTDPFMEEFNRSARKSIRRVLQKDFVYEIIRAPDTLNQFINIYYDTMDRNAARSFYYFSQDYFDTLLKSFRDNILNINVFVDDICIASGLYFVYGKYLHAHLSGTKSEYLEFSPAYLLKYLTCQWSKDHNIDYIHYGGGISNDPEDSLLQFKSKFTRKGFFDFYIGKKIYNREVYAALVKKSKTENSYYFPQYRS